MMQECTDLTKQANALGADKGNGALTRMLHIILSPRAIRAPSRQSRSQYSAERRPQSRRTARSRTRSSSGHTP